MEKGSVDKTSHKPVYFKIKFHQSKQLDYIFPSSRSYRRKINMIGVICTSQYFILFHSNEPLYFMLNEESIGIRLS